MNPRATKIAHWCAAVLVGVGAGSGYASEPRTPIKHLIVVIGENVSFDALFATY